MYTRVFSVAVFALALQATVCQAQTPDQIWQDKCSLCHGTITRFARQNLNLTDSVPVLRQDGQALATFLLGHGRVSADEISAICRTIAAELENSRQQ